jgi:hypothetical protein
LTASARDAASEVRVGTKKRALRSNKETDEGQRFAALVNSLTKNAPYKGLLGKGWIERRGVGNETCYRITQKGLLAKTAPVRI